MINHKEGMKYFVQPNISFNQFKSGMQQVLDKMVTALSTF